MRSHQDNGDSGARGEKAGRFAKTQEELAQRLGITRKTVTNCLRDYKASTPPAPRARDDGRYDVVEWTQFVLAHNIARKAESADPEDLPPGPRNATDWKAHKVKLECQKIEIEIRKTEGELVEVADVEKTTGAVMSAFRTTLNNLPGRAAQKLVGLRDYHEIQSILQKEVDVCLRTLEACEYLPPPNGASPGVRNTPPDTDDSHSTAGGEKITITRRPKRSAVPKDKLPKKEPQSKRKKGTSPSKSGRAQRKPSSRRRRK